MIGRERFLYRGCGLGQLYLGFLEWYISFNLAQCLDRMLKGRDCSSGRPLISSHQRSLSVQRIKVKFAIFLSEGFARAKVGRVGRI